MTENQNITISQTVNKSVPTPTKFLSLGLTTWLIDIFVTKFIGIDTIAFAGMFTLEKLLRFSLNGITLLFLTMYVLSQKKAGKEALMNILSFIVLEIMIFYVILLGGLTGGNFNHIFNAFAAYFFLIRPVEKERPYVANFMFAAILFLDYFVLNYMYSEMKIRVYIIPLWFFAMVFFTNRLMSERPDLMQPSKFSHFLTWTVIGLLTFAYAGSVAGFQDISSRLDPSVESDFQEMVSNAKSNFLKSFLNIKKAINDTKNSTMAVYREEYYTGEVDQNADKDLGVFIDKLELISPEFFTDEPVSLWGTLIVHTLDDSITVKTNCTGNKEYVDRRRDANIFTPAEFTAIQYDEVPVDCTFDKFTFRSGTQYITISSTFDFRTLGYQKKYFINKDRAYALKRQELEPLESYGIDDTKPTAVYTAGPVMIGMDTREDLISIDLNSNEQTLVLGVTIDNAWDGRIESIDELIITVPDALELDGLCSGYKFDPADTGASGKSYKLMDKVKVFEKFKTFRCTFKINSPASLLGEAPLAIRYFKADVKYTYTIDKTINVLLKDSKDIMELRINTSATVPRFEKRSIPMERNSVITINLSEFASDPETPKKYFTYKLGTTDKKSYTSSSVRVTWEMVDCQLRDVSLLVCKTRERSGIANLSVTVDDLTRTNKTKYTLCVGMACPPEAGTAATGTGSTGTTGSPPSSGPIQTSPLPAVTLSATGGETQIYLPSYIQDGDGVTNVQDMTFRFPDNDVYISRTTSMNTNLFLSAKNTYSCVSNHPYTFTATDRDGNTQSYTISVTVGGCT